MIDQHNQTHKKPTLTFTLVHGTFAKNADWVVNEDDPKMFRSKLRAELKKDYQLRFEVVCWGHKGFFPRLMDNTNKARFFGIDELKKHLLDCDDATTTNLRYIVAHSHGGNIVMCTLKQPELLKKVTGVICLSSPFLKYKEVPFNRSLLGFSAVLLLIYASTIEGFAIWTYASIYLAVVATIMVTGNLGLTEASREKIAKRRGELELAKKENFSEQPGRPSFLAIRPHRDEVTILFWITRGLGNAFRWLWEFINKIGAWLIAIFFVSGMIIIGVEKLPFSIDTDSLQSIRSLADQFVLTPLLLITTAVLSVMVVMRWSYAFDSVPWIASLGVESKIVPWEGAQKRVMDTFGLVKHTRIQNQSTSEIADWIRKSHQV